MFNIKYRVPLFETAQISTWSVTTSESAETAKTTAFKSSSPLGTSFVIQDLVFHYPPKPFGEPIGRTGRVHNVYVDSYKPWESLQLSAHLATPQHGAVAVSEQYTALIAKHVYDNRNALFIPKNRPKSMHDLVSERMKYGRILSDIPLPLAITDTAGSVLTGIDLSIVGWGAAVHKAHMVPTSSLKAPERVAYASYHPVPAGPRQEGLFVTDIFLVAPRKGGADDDDVCITEVPLRRDGSLTGPSPILLDPTSGLTMWRKIGPQDIVPGSVGAATFNLRNISNLSKTQGTVNKRIPVSSLYFRRPGFVKRGLVHVEQAHASRADTMEILQALAVSEALSGSDENPGPVPDSVTTAVAEHDDDDEEEEKSEEDCTDEESKHQGEVDEINAVFAESDALAASAAYAASASAGSKRSRTAK